VGRPPIKVVELAATYDIALEKVLWFQSGTCEPHLIGSLLMPFRHGFVVLALALGVPAIAHGQMVFESTGERALGMGGAFVAVANDSTATFWNPAGLVVGAPASATFGWSRFQGGNPKANPEPGLTRRTGTLTSIGSWPAGLSYGHFTHSSLGARDDGLFTVETLHTSQVGLTILQTLAEGLIGGLTVRYMRGDVVQALSDRPTVEEAFAATDDMQGKRSGALDLDAGLMADMRRLRVGLTLRNLRSPSFGESAQNRVTIPRETRLGIAILPTDGLTLAMDLDLERVDLRDDLRRMVAFGGEGRIGRHLAVRTGIRWDLEGDRRLLGTAGLSISLRSGIWLDGHYAHGRHVEDREFGAALRAGL
jgi:hypothetical protein